MPTISLKDLTDKQRELWQMRYRYRWRMKKIALAMGISTPAASQLLRRAQRSAGLPRRANVSVIRVKPRIARMQSLSGVYDY